MGRGKSSLFINVEAVADTNSLTMLRISLLKAVAFIEKMNKVRAEQLEKEDLVDFIMKNRCAVFLE